MSDKSQTTRVGRCLAVTVLLGLAVPAVTVWLVGMGSIVSERATISLGLNERHDAFRRQLARLEADTAAFDRMTPNEQQASIRRSCPECANYIDQVEQFSAQLQTYTKTVRKFPHAE